MSSFLESLSELNELLDTQSDDYVVVRPLNSSKLDFFGVVKNGDVRFYFHVNSADSGSDSNQSFVNYELKNFRCSAPEQYSLQNEDGLRKTGLFALVEVGYELGREVHSYLAGYLSEVSKVSISNRNVEDVQEIFWKAFQIFEKLHSQKSIDKQGLWGELYFIANRKNPAEVLTAWIADPFGVWDFIFDDMVLDVKTTTGRNRHHKLTGEQLLGRMNESLCLVSFQLQKSKSGLSLGRLYRHIYTHVEQTERIALSEFVAERLGLVDLLELDHICYDARYTESNVYIANLTEIKGLHEAQSHPAVKRMILDIDVDQFEDCAQKHVALKNFTPGAIR